MENRVLALQLEDVNIGDAAAPVIERRPIVPGANFVTREAGDVCIAYGKQIPGINTGATHECYAKLSEMKVAGSSGLYTVFAKDKETLDKVGPGKNLEDHVATSLSNKQGWLVYRVDGTMPDPEDSKKTIAVKGALVEFEGQAPAQDASQSKPWTVGGMTITKAWPSVRRSVGAEDMAAAVKPASMKAMEIGD